MSTKSRPTPPSTDYAAPALEKGLDILELLCDQGGGLTQKEIAGRLDRSAAEIFRMLAVLERRGYVRRDRPAESYHLTSRLFELSHRHPPTGILLETALVRMRLLSRQIGQSCHLAVRDDDHVVTIGQSDSPGFRGFSVRVGTRLPWWETTSGLVLLAFAPDDVSGDLLARVGQSIPAGIKEQLSQVKRTGVAERQSTSVQGIMDISAPIRDCLGIALAALTVPCLIPVNRPFDVRKQVVAPVLAAAANISEVIGGGVAPTHSSPARNKS